MECWCCYLLMCIGLMWVLRQMIDLLDYCWHRNQSLDPYKWGWAVITGATDGIGKATAFELLQKGFKVVLISRSQAKLETVQHEFKDKYPGSQVEIIQANFSDSAVDPHAWYLALADKLAPYEVSVLVNNVGIMHWKAFEHSSFDDLNEMLSVNIFPQTFLTHSLLPSMTAQFRSSHRRSLIINLSSSASIVPTPYLAVYGATKSYNDYLSQALSAETPPGVTVVSVLPGMVATNLPEMNHIPKMPGAVKAEECAKAILRNTGLGRTGGHRMHQVLCWVFEHLLNNRIGRLIAIGSINRIEASIAKGR